MTPEVLVFLNSTIHLYGLRVAILFSVCKYQPLHCLLPLKDPSAANV